MQYGSNGEEKVVQKKGLLASGTLYTQSSCSATKIGMSNRKAAICRACMPDQEPLGDTGVRMCRQNMCGREYMQERPLTCIYFAGLAAATFYRNIQVSYSFAMS